MVMKSTGTLCPIPDDELSIPEYWKKHSGDIAVDRQWAPANHGTYKTLIRYDGMMKKLAPELPDKPISQVTLFELTRAVDGVRYKARGGKPYKKTSLNGFYTLLSDIFRYAKDHGHADNILLLLQNWNSKKELSPFDFFDPSFSTEELQEKARELVQNNPNKVKSLTKQQRLALYLEISNGLMKDGRDIALAIMLYCGLRPSECRGLTWGDILPFRDHPDRRMFVLYKTQGNNGEKRDQMKTGNAYRYIPIHYELDQLLWKRYEYVKANYSGNKKIDDLPICCFKNQLSTPCKDFQFSSFGSDVLSHLAIPKDDLLFYMAYMITERADADNSPEEAPAHLSLYVLRRNFCTWVQGETLMDQMQRNYVMGHTMRSEHKDLRQQYNGEDSLFQMLQLMDKAVLNGNYNRPPYALELSPGTSIDLADQGCVTIRIPKPINGHVVRITAIAAEADDPILLISDHAIVKNALKTMQAQVTSLEPNKQILPINTETDERAAWNTVISRAKRKP